MNYFKFMSLFMIIYLNFMGFMSNNWLMIWIIMELSFMMFMGLMTSATKYSVVELMMKYYLIQVFFSLMFLMMIIDYVYNLFMSFYSYMSMFLFIKLGVFPFHFWLIMIVGKMDWVSFFVMSTFMKIVPLTFIFYMFSKFDFSLILSISAIWGSMAGINNSSFQKMLTYSSMVQLSWIMLTFYISISVSLVYLLSYWYIVFLIMVMLMKKEIYFINQFKVSSAYLSFKFILFFSVLVLGGLPPFLGFMIKLMVTYFMLVVSSKFLIFVLLIFSLFSVYFYFQMYFYLFLLFNYQVKWVKLDLVPLGGVIFISFVGYLGMFLFY